MKKFAFILTLLSAGSLGCGVIYLGWNAPQSGFANWWGWFALSFLGYWSLAHPSLQPRQEVWVFALALLLRLGLVGAFPVWSDDVYRFVWDGRLLVQGHNPFWHLPSFFLQPGQQLPGLDAELFARLNSPNYYSIYPPVTQVVFGLAVGSAFTDLGRAAVVMKLVLWLAELGNLVLLRHLLQRYQRPASAWRWYGLNPLVILEVMGNLHFEALMIFFLLLALYYWERQAWAWSGWAWALAIGVKLIPLLFLPLLMRPLGWGRRAWWFWGALVATLILSFLPFLSWDFLRGFGGSLDLYFQKFEFNASIYYLLRAGIQQMIGLNPIMVLGPLLALATMAIIAKLAYQQPLSPLPMSIPTLLLANLAYLGLATTVHPWYVLMPLALSVLTLYRFVALWSGLVVLSYSHYHQGHYQEVLPLIALEYLSVLLCYWVESGFFQRQWSKWWV